VRVQFYHDHIAVDERMMQQLVQGKIERIESWQMWGGMVLRATGTVRRRAKVELKSCRRTAILRAIIKRRGISCTTEWKEVLRSRLGGQKWWQQLQENERRVWVAWTIKIRPSHEDRAGSIWTSGQSYARPRWGQVLEHRRKIKSRWCRVDAAWTCKTGKSREGECDCLCDLITHLVLACAQAHTVL
jgi:hypothetical protein